MYNGVSNQVSSLMIITKTRIQIINDDVKCFHVALWVANNMSVTNKVRRKKIKMQKKLIGFKSKLKLLFLIFFKLNFFYGLVGHS